MKKFITILLTLTIVLGLCACGGGEGGSAAKEGLQVGYCKENITPDFPVGMSGYADQGTRLHTQVVSYVYLTCIAASEGGETVLMYTVDMSAFIGDNLTSLREAVTAATGIPVENIFIGATHNHSGPATGSKPEGKQFKELLLKAAVTSAQNAIADLAPATMLTTTQEVKGMTFVRHYKMQDGTYAGANFGSFTASPIEGHATEANDEMVLIKFDRGEDKKDILMVNWQAHVANAHEIGYTSLSADYVGAMRDKVEADTGMLVAYFTGSSGNQNIESRISDEMHYMTWDQYGVKLGEHCIAALPSLTEVGSTGIKTNRYLCTVNIDHSWDHMLKEAQEVNNMYSQSGNVAATALCQKYGFTSHHQTRHIVSRYDMDETDQLELNAFRIGDIGFITGTYEMFSTSALYVRENSPFDTTFIITGNGGYIPDEKAYDYRSYEADTSTYAKGTAETLEKEFIRMLGEVKQ